ncbi:molybdopterin molybdotransferase MoeA [Spiractinospora alimapuensis]|uniref:molybdotransferase-like divisome protein Glp n=1 Tax=Spiractinospora alimapuensis TaxID=2820884 RepID=UPI001F3A2B65|nr:gephyrin-like molybdotransferase Glp [Spiractinospora alimapuensis]QVQ51338.1 molybdopterin molybdotransferase MoeA [Spiractinospora alimapuensis]
MKTVDQHVADIVGTVRPLDPVEVDLADAHGTVLAEPVTAPVSLPPFDNSAMDGYAVRAADVTEATEASPVSLLVVGDIAAGDTAAHTVNAGTTLRIMTGAPMPSGADAVVPVEWTDGGVTRVEIRRPAAAGGAVRPAGGDVLAGAEVLTPGTRLTAGALGVLAAVGRRKVRVRPRPRVAVLSTGEELVAPGTSLAPGQIWESNSYCLAAAAEEVGAVGRRYDAVRDDTSTVLRRIQEVLSQADIVVTSGGVSMGAYDVVKEVLSELGTVTFEQVAMQPGKPQGYGTVGDPAVPILTLPGNPVSSYVSFALFVRPALRVLQGLEPTPLPTVRARLDTPVRSPAGRRSYLRGVLTYDPAHAATESGAPPYRVETASRQESHQLSALAATDSLVQVPEDETELPAGTVVEVVKLPTMM